MFLSSCLRFKYGKLCLFGDYFSLISVTSPPLTNMLDLDCNSLWYLSSSICVLLNDMFCPCYLRLCLIPVGFLNKFYDKWLPQLRDIWFILGFLNLFFLLFKSKDPALISLMLISSLRYLITPHYYYYFFIFPFELYLLWFLLFLKFFIG